MARPKTITEERKKTSVDIPMKLYKKIEDICKKDDRKPSWVINNLLKIALSGDK